MHLTITHSPVNATAQTSTRLNVDLILAAAFGQPRDPRSAEYKAGVRAALAFRIDSIAIKRPYAAGTSADDAFDAGLAEGNSLWRHAAAEQVGGAA